MRKGNCILISCSESRGKSKKKFLEYYAEDVDSGLSIVSSKVGFDIKKHSANMARKARY